MEPVISVVWLLIWIVASRQLFRWAVRNEFPRIHSYLCTGYDRTHNSSTCPNYRTLNKVVLAGLAMLAAFFLPVTLLFAAVMYRAPLSRSELDQKIRQLENENSRLRGIK